MDVGISLALAFLFGIIQTFGSAGLAAVTRRRGGREASLTMQMATAVVLAGLLVWIAVNEGRTQFVAPLDSALVFAAAVPLIAAYLGMAIRGLPVWYAAAGLSSLQLVLAPRLVGDLGLALFFSAGTLGSCSSALVFDHIGALGAAKRAATLPRIGGLALVGFGVVLVRAS
ncbi:MAG: DMT family transporter [Dehalococcoidia bacterium]|nr:DMT family transporter [Dehalococcoidia bacterium]